MNLVLLFSLDDETYGFEIDAIQEVVEDPARHFVPRAGGVLLAAINLHGRILPVIDLPGLFGFGGDQRDHRLVVLTPRYHSLAVAVSRLGRIVSLDLTLLQPAPAGQRQAAVRGVIESEASLINLLDADAVISQLKHIFAE